MGHSHAHVQAHDGRHEDWLDPARERRLMRIVTTVVLPLTALLVGILVHTWPAGHPSGLPFLGSQGTSTYVSAVVTNVAPYSCVSTGDGTSTGASDGNRCATVTAQLVGHSDLGTQIQFDADPSLMRQGIASGAHVVVSVTTTDGTTTYEFQDYDRGNTVWLLAGVLALIVIAVGRLQGLRSLLGLAAGFALVVGYAVPKLAGGAHVVPLLLVMLPLLTVTLLYTAHGFSVKTTAAIIGTLAATGLAIIGAIAAVKGLHLSGLSSEDDQLLLDNLPNINLADLLTVGIVVSGFGALNDVTVTQASAVWELAASETGRRANRTFAAAMRIGRDHVASAIYTVAFAYAGSSLVTLMFIMMSSVPSHVVLNSELMADEIAFLAVGLSAVVLSMPITTWVAKLLVSTVRRRG